MFATIVGAAFTTEVSVSVQPCASVTVTEYKVRQVIAGRATRYVDGSECTRRRYCIAGDNSVTSRRIERKSVGVAEADSTGQRRRSTTGIVRCSGDQRCI